ncbi:MAG: tetratricopeptide repeat protein [Candidatus Gastranaerophilales bacterium]|nr:tetratricopeptide repeat protein [Candidatus Gastranaerophilales bacterium]
MKKFLGFLFILLSLNYSQAVFAAYDAYEEKKQQIVFLYNTNKLKEAYQLISQIPEEERDGKIWLMAANITQDYGRNLDAEFLLQKAISVEPKNYKLYYNLGNLYFNQNKYNAAIAEYKLSLKHNKEFSHAWNNMGLAYFHLEDFKKAKSAFMRAISFQGSNADFYYNLACTYKKLNNKKQAEKMLNIYNTMTEQKES